MDKYRQHYSNPSLAKHLPNTGTIYPIENWSFKQNPPILSETHMQMQRLCRLLATSEFSQLQITYDNVNLLRLGSCLVHSSESYQVVDRKLSPLSTPPLLQRDEGESSKAFATDASSWKIIAPIFAAVEEQPGCVSHISEALGRMRNESRRIRNELLLQSPFGYTRKTRLLSNQNLKMPVAVSHKLLTRLCTVYTRGSG